MVNIKYTGSRFTRRRLPNGRWIAFRPNETVEIESEDSLKNSKRKGTLLLQKAIPQKLGLGLRLTSNLLSLGADLLNPKQKPKPKKK